MRALIFALTLIFSTLTFASSDPIVSKALQSGTITKVEARNLYLLKNRTWADGARIHVYRMPLDSKEHREFVRDILSLNAVQFEAEWDKLVNSGLAPAITEVRNNKEMLGAITRSSVGIGYLNHDYLIIYGAGYDVQIIRIID